VISLRSGNPIVFHDGQVDQDITSPDRRDLHTYGKQFQTRWVTVHDNATDGMATFDANALAKAQGATPFKRPENGVCRPGSGFRQFVLGTEIPHPWVPGSLWRVFFTAQHGDNDTWQLIRN
jgi:hypothetical protein